MLLRSGRCAPRPRTSRRTAAKQNSLERVALNRAARFARTGKPKEQANGLVMLSDILPTGFECGVLNGKVEPGSTVAIVGAGPIGLAALLTAQFYSPAQIIMIDMDDSRLQISSRFGATTIINNKDGKAVEKIMKMTGSRGVDTAIEAGGVPASFIDIIIELTRRGR